MMATNKPAIQSLVQICKAHQLQGVVISPGSRNAPLTVAFNEDAYFKTYSIIDERSAGFFALGMAQHTGKASILVCTSGSAALNYGPAVAEAYYQQVPLLILTADRPEEWIDQGVGQSMRQRALYQNYIIKSFNLPQEAETEQALWYSDRLVNEAILLSAKGPVHVNIPFKEPLYGQAVHLEHLTKIISSTEGKPTLSKQAINELHQIWKQSPKVMLLAGMMPFTKTLNDKVSDLLERHSNIALLGETNSNLYHSSAVSCIDRTIALIKDAKKLQPDLLITMGHSVISKRIKKMLQQMDIAHHWHVAEQAKVIDTYQSLTKLVVADLTNFVAHLLYFEQKDDVHYQEQWTELALQARQQHENYLNEADFSDLKAFNCILPRIPKNSVVQAGNSAAVRYCQLFDYREGLEYHSNRGVSGIDGCTSTALGFMVASAQLVTLITGDIAFFYDVNALWNTYLTKRLKIIIINNAGGGIFRIIDGPSTTKAFESFFETTHRTNAKHVAQTYGLQYFEAMDEQSLTEQLDHLYQCNEPAILEVFTPRLENDKVLKDYFRFIQMT